MARKSFFLLDWETPATAAGPRATEVSARSHRGERVSPSFPRTQVHVPALQDDGRRQPQPGAWAGRESGGRVSTQRPPQNRTVSSRRPEQTAAGQSTGLSGAPPAVGIPNTPPGPRRLHRSVSPHGCAMRHAPPWEHAVLIPPRDDRFHQSPHLRCAAHAYRTPDERGREADPGRGRRRGRPGATGGTLLLLLGPWSSLSASPGLASSPGGSTHGFLPVGSEGLGVPPVRGLPRTPSTPPPDSAPAGSSRPDVWDLGRPATHTEGGGPISL